MTAMTNAAVDATMAATIMQGAGVFVAEIHVKWVEDGDITYADWRVSGTTDSGPVSVTPTFETTTSLLVDWDGEEIEADHVASLTALLRSKQTCKEQK